MKIAIVGCGVAGFYLLNRIPPEHEVEAFEMREKDKWWAVCAWGTSAPFISDLVEKAGLNFEDYILFRGKSMIVDPGNGKTFNIKLNGLVTFDKTRLFGDMKKGKNIHWGAHPKDINELKGFDMVIDATGFHRSILGKLEHDAAIPCFEVEVEGKFPWDDFYIKPYPGLSGYFWYFPLGEGRGHIGAGDFKSQYRGEIEAMVKKYDWKVVRSIGRPVRILAPAYMGPFYTEPKCLACGGTIHQKKLLRSANERAADCCREHELAKARSPRSRRGGSRRGELGHLRRQVTARAIALRPGQTDRWSSAWGRASGPCTRSSARG